MTFNKQTCVRFIEKQPFIFALIMSFLNICVLFSSYFIKNKFFPGINSILVMLAPLWFLLSILLCLLYAMLDQCLINNKVPEKFKFNAYCVFSLLIIIFSAVVLPDRTMRHFEMGNYNASLVLSQEGRQLFSKFSEVIIKPDDIVENIHVVWAMGERCFIRIPVENNQFELVDINLSYIDNILNNENISRIDENHFEGI